MRNGKLTLLALSFILAGTAPLFGSGSIDLTPPKFALSNSILDDVETGSAIHGLLDDFTNIMDSQIDRAFKTIQGEIDKVVGGIDGDPEEFIGAFASSSVFSSAGATQRGYEGYDRFAVTLGPMVGIQLPTDPFSLVNEVQDLADNLQKHGDIRLGLNPQALNAQIGINASFLLDNLYLGAKVGYMTLDSILPKITMGEFKGDIAFDTFSAGALASYQLLSPRSIGLGVLRWRGVSVGAGFIYQRTKLGFDANLGTYTESARIPGLDLGTELAHFLGDVVPHALTNDFNITATLTPRLAMSLNVNTYTVPVEAVTAVRLFGILNLSAGLGVDIGFGTASLKVSGWASPHIGFSSNEIENVIHVAQDADLRITAGGDHSPATFSPKIMAGLGFCLGPAIIDIPVTVYPLVQGYSLGLTLGAAF